LYRGSTDLQHYTAVQLTYINVEYYNWPTAVYSGTIGHINVE